MLFYESGGHDRAQLAQDPFQAIVAPRPIGGVSTIAANGSVNLVPYSFFNAVAEAPAMLAFCSHGFKDPVTFAGEVQELSETPAVVMTVTQTSRGRR